MVGLVPGSWRDHERLWEMECDDKSACFPAVVGDRISNCGAGRGSWPALSFSGGVTPSSIIQPGNNPK